MRPCDFRPFDSQHHAKESANNAQGLARCCLDDIPHFAKRWQRYTQCDCTVPNGLRGYQDGLPEFSGGWHAHSANFGAIDDGAIGVHCNIMLLHRSHHLTSIINFCCCSCKDNNNPEQRQSLSECRGDIACSTSRNDDADPLDRFGRNLAQWSRTTVEHNKPVGGKPRNFISVASYPAVLSGRCLP